MNLSVEALTLAPIPQVRTFHFEKVLENMKNLQCY